MKMTKKELTALIDSILAGSKSTKNPKITRIQLSFPNEIVDKIDNYRLEEDEPMPRNEWMIKVICDHIDSME